MAFTRFKLINLDGVCAVLQKKSQMFLLKRAKSIASSTAGTRSFSGASINRGLFKDYISKLSVPEITSKELAQVLQKDSIHGPPANFHLLDVR
jgi:hypothetical protein